MKNILFFLFKWNLKNEKTEKKIAIFEQGIKNETNRDILLFLYMESKNEKTEKHIVIFVHGVKN